MIEGETCKEVVKGHTKAPGIDELTSRCVMGRKGRIHIPGAVYHVILRGNDGQDIFADDKDGFRFYSILDIARQHFTFKIHAFCLMTSHFHLELQVADVPLPKIMQCIAQRYVQ